MSNKYNDWAKKEVELACKRENPNWDGKSFDYGCSCYMNALEAYKAAVSKLNKAGHSGYSYGCTVSILKRLLDGKPLNGIRDEDFDKEPYCVSEDGVKNYENHRYHPLFKNVYPDGTVEYIEVNRTVSFNIDEPDICWGGGIGSRIVNNLFPIKLPYYPTDKPFKVAFREGLHDKALGDYDLQGIYYVLKPDGEKVEINKFYKTVVDHWYRYDDDDKYIFPAESEMIEITQDEFDELLTAEQIESKYEGENKLEIRESPKKHCLESADTNESIK